MMDLSMPAVRLRMLGPFVRTGGAPLPPALALSVCVEVVEWVCLGGVGVHAEGLEQVWLDDGRVDREGDA